MSFRVVEILEAQPEGTLAKVSHGNTQVTSLIANGKTDDLVVGMSFEAAIGYDEIVGWKVISDFEDARSGMWQEQDGVHLCGRIHSLLDYGDGKTIVDVYMQNGSEVFQVDLEAIGDAVLESDSGLEITVARLYLYPRR